MPRALVRRPGPQLADGLLTHRQRVPVDTELAAAQWAAYVRALAEAGWTIIEVDPDDGSPDSVFVEDALVLFDEVAVVTRPGAHARRSETAGAEASARQLGLSVAHIEAPATLDGGDVLKVDGHVYVGVGGRTNREAVAQLRSLLDARRWTVTAVPVARVLHLKSAVTALPDGTVIGFRPLVDDPDVFESFEEVPEESGSHVVVLDRHRLLMASDAPRTAGRLRSRGYDVVEVDISEFEKLEGCVTCLSVRDRRG